MNASGSSLAAVNTARRHGPTDEPPANGDRKPSSPYSALLEPDVLARSGPPATAAIPSGSRIAWLDGARGLSIAAMILSHVGLFTGLTPTWFHLYVMRPAAPVFLLLLGMLWRPGFRRRHWQLIGATVVAQLLAIPLGFALPNILVLMCAGLLVMRWAVRVPVATLALCFTQLAFWPMPEWFTGYPPGFVLGLMVVGHCIPADRIVKAYGHLGQRLHLDVIGRYPVRFYLGHLLVLVLVLFALTGWPPFGWGGEL